MTYIFNDQMKENMKKQANQALKDKGFDELNRLLLLLLIIFLFIDIFFKIFIIGILFIITLIIFLFRLFSKNRYKRVKENRIFLDIIGYFKNPIRNFKKLFTRKNKVNKSKNNIYHKCPKCGLMLKLPLPKKRGIKHTTCPDCGTRFGFLALRIRKEK